MKKKDASKVTQSKLLEEEIEHRGTRNNLVESAKRKVRRPKPSQKRASILNVHLTDKEITQLRNIAAEKGLDPPAYARQVLKDGIEQEKIEHKDTYSRDTNINTYTRASVIKDNILNNQNGICVFDTSKSRIEPDILQPLLDMLDKACKCRMITPKEIGYEEAERLITGQ